MSINYAAKIQNLINSIDTQFKNRTVNEARKTRTDFGVSLTIKNEEGKTLWLMFSKSNNVNSITIPMPYEENGVSLIQHNEVIRAISPFWIELGQMEIDYLMAIHMIVLGNPKGLVSDDLVRKSSYLQRMIYAFNNNNQSIVAHMFQQAINEVVIKMPIHETLMQSFMMNNRLMFVDNHFDNLRNPAELLKYQVHKATKYFDLGWTSLGLSDQSMAQKNYILKTDLKRLTPFGMRYHNPQRNLYSTLGMKGDELPNIISEISSKLERLGIYRTGWNLFTAFVDIPDIFEDQIMVDSSHSNKFVTYKRRMQAFGFVRVEEGQIIKTGDLICISPDNERMIFETRCDEAKIIKISKTIVSVGGIETEAHNVLIEYKRRFRDGIKFTNMHGNKGIIRLATLGHAIDPRTGERRKIDVIVGAKTVGKRKNYGQILEVLTGCLLYDGEFGPDKRIIIGDDWTQDIQEISEGLVKRGYRADATWDCDTYVGKIKAVCGTMFWGVIKTPEDQVWKDKATFNRNIKGIREAGLKFSHVEFRAIETRFGPNNAIMAEIMSYAQGADNLNELLQMLEAKTGVVPNDKPILMLGKVKPLDQNQGIIVPKEAIEGTVVDEFFHPEGFVLRLPLEYMTLRDGRGETDEGSPLKYQYMPSDERAGYDEYVTDRLFIPGGALRKCWKHQTGRYGLSEVGVLVNNVVIMGHRLLANTKEANNHKLYYDSIKRLFDSIADILGSKKGEISTCGMAVRYPYSAKAVATLSNALPYNTVEIHKSMAEILEVTNGEIVLVERFPCLGFMSVKPQRVRVTDDPLCEYTIRASSNSLVCENLDFDGDVLYLASFHTPDAKAELRRELETPNKACYEEIIRLNKRKGCPRIKEYTLQDFKIQPFEKLTKEKHAEIVEKNTGVKSQTGPVINLTYNIMRIVENSDLAKDQDMKVAIEMFLEKAAQSVFEQKHGGKSLYEIVIEGVCTANAEMLIEVGFDRVTTESLCTLIKTKAASLGVFDLITFHTDSKKRGSSDIVSRIVREFNKIYFASRSKPEGISLLKTLKEKAVDIPSKMYKWVTAGKADRIKTELDKRNDRKIASVIKDTKIQDAACDLFDVIDTLLTNKDANVTKVKF